MPVYPGYEHLDSPVATALALHDAYEALVECEGVHPAIDAATDAVAAAILAVFPDRDDFANIIELHR